MIAIDHNGLPAGQIVLPEIEGASPIFREMREAVRALHYSPAPDGDGDALAAKSDEALSNFVAVQADTLPDLALKLTVAMHAIAPSFDKQGETFGFLPADCPTSMSSQLLAAVLNDLIAMAESSEPQHSNWDRAIAAYDAARAAEEHYDRTVWRAEYDAEQAGGPAMPAQINDTMEKVAEATYQAEQAFMHMPAETAEQVLTKVVIAFDEDRDANGYIDPILADAKRLGGRATR